MSMFATPRTPAHDEEGPDKASLVGSLAVFRPLEYESARATKYGTAATVRCELWVVEGEHAGHYVSWFAAGNLARQIGEALDLGAMAPGRIESGRSPSGRDWFGVAWATDEADVAAAEAAVRATQVPAPAAGKVGPTRIAPVPAPAPAEDDEPPF